MDNLMVAIIIVALTSIFVSIIPVIIGAIKGKIKLGIGGFFACLAGGMILGPILAVPVCAVFVYLLCKDSKTCQNVENNSTPPPKLHHRQVKNRIIVALAIVAFIFAFIPLPIPSAASCRCKGDIFSNRKSECSYCLGTGIAFQFQTVWSYMNPPMSPSSPVPK